MASETVEFVTINTTLRIPFINIRGPINYPIAMSATRIKDLRTLGFDVVVHRNTRIDPKGNRIILDTEVEVVVEEEILEDEGTQDEAEKVETPAEPAPTEEVVEEDLVADEAVDEEYEEFVLPSKAELEAKTKAALLDFIEALVKDGVIEQPEGYLKGKSKADLVSFILELDQ